jgi:hypothetical protein
MSNIAFDLEVFKKVAALVTPPGDPKIAALGAIGPDLYQYVPISNALSTQLVDAVDKAINSLTPAQIQAMTVPAVDLNPILSNPTLSIELFEKPLMAAYSVLFSSVVVPFWELFQRDVDLLNQLQTAADSQNSNALKNLAGQTGQLTNDAATLKGLVPALLAVVGASTTIAAIPPSIESTQPGATPWLPLANRLFEFLRWHRTDIFARNLVNSADSSANDDLKAYAYGHLCHFAASVTGKPFINNIVGGPYRTHWWRNRLVSNFVDAWTFGRYETPAMMSGDTPTPAYTSPSWANINVANLQDRFNVAGLSAPAGKLPDAVNAVATGNLGSLPQQFPSDLANYINQTITDSYPAALLPKLPPDMAFAPERVQEAFVGLFAVVWFMTSGFGPMTPLQLGSAPSTCTSQPSWVGNGPPPSPQQSGPSGGATATGVVLSILALLSFLFQNWPAGVAAVVGAIAAFASGGSIDWDQLGCNIFWLRNELLQAQLALADGLAKSGLGYPQPDKLGTTDSNGMVHPAVDGSPNGGMPLTKSSPGGDSPAVAMPPYPHQLDASVGGFADLNFFKFPQTPVETPITTSLPLGPGYAEQIVDLSGLQNGGMLASHGFPTDNVFFGDAVANAQQVIADHAKTLPPFNLDADRGYGWKAWDPAVSTFPGNGQVNNPKQEA